MTWPNAQIVMKEIPTKTRLVRRYTTGSGARKNERAMIGVVLIQLVRGTLEELLMMLRPCVPCSRHGSRESRLVSLVLV